MKQNIKIVKMIMATLAVVILVSLSAQAQYHANCWLSEKSGYSINFYGSNPSVADFHAEIRALAVQYKVPVEIIGAVCHQESVGGYQYDADGYNGPGHVGTGFVVHNIAECEYAFTHGSINSSGGAPPPGLGLMQLTAGTATSTGDPGRLITDWRFNLEAGVKVLVSKYNAALADDPSWMEQLEKDNMQVLENWFYGLRYYNGYKSQANDPTSYLTYLDAIYGKIASLPSNGRLNGLFSPVTITKPASVIGGWADGNSFVALPTGEWKDKDNNSFSGSVHVSGGGTTTTTAGIPTGGRRIYVRIWSLINGAWQISDTTYTAASGGGTTTAKAVMTTPAPGTILAGSTVAFGWSAGQGVSEYFLYLGNSQGANDLYGRSQGTSRSATISGIPTDGRKIYVRIWSYINGAWQSSDTTYTAKG